MKKLKSFAVFILVLFASNQINAQNSTAADYMESISVKYRTIQQEMWDYTKAVAHGKGAKKIESRRTALISTTFNAISQVKKMDGFEGNTSYRDSVVSFLNMYYLIIKEDYAKIVDMEEISERSYDDMEAYMTAKDLADQKMKEASQMVAREQAIFAAKHNITLLEATDDLSKKMAIANEVYAYYKVVYLIFFKAYIQEKYLVEAINKSDVSGIEQNKNALIPASKEGLEKLKKIEAFNNDLTVVAACTQLLEFYQDEAENKVKVITDYFIKTENFNSIKKSFDEIKPNNRTQEDVDRFNNAVNEMNAAVAEYNKTNAKLGEDRKKYIDNWNSAVAKFTDKHVPKGKV